LHLEGASVADPCDAPPTAQVSGAEADDSAKRASCLRERTMIASPRLKDPCIAVLDPYTAARYVLEPVVRLSKSPASA
jgi:hypothetical protein